MEQQKPTLQQAFSYWYFLMLSADKIADLEELNLGSKIIKYEKLDKSAVMKDMDYLSSISREDAYKQGVNYLKSLDNDSQLKVLVYMKLIAKADGSYSQKESELLHEISLNELNISLKEIAKKEASILKAIEEIK